VAKAGAADRLISTIGTAIEALIVFAAVSPLSILDVLGRVSHGLLSGSMVYPFG